MARFITLLAACVLMAAPALAGQASGSFHVGITILPPGSTPAAGLPKRHRVLANPFIRSLAPVRRYTWGAASVSLVRAGFTGLSPAGQMDFVYFFSARRGGQSYRVAVSASTGSILKVWPA